MPEEGVTGVYKYTNLWLGRGGGGMERRDGFREADGIRTVREEFYRRESVEGLAAASISPRPLARARLKRPCK